jgi:DNA (cytosine-5)-methyltransferase 1
MHQPDKGCMPSQIRFIDLFAGIGGFRLALESVGAKCVFSSEWDRYSQESYKANFGESPEGDITKISPREIPSHEILCAGFPCQSFSQAGLKKGFNDTRGTLFFDIARIANYHRPKVIFLENVKRFSTHDEGKTLQVVKETLEAIGYRFYWKVLNARDFGVPQNRERIYMIGFLEMNSFVFPKGKKKETKVRDILEPTVPDKYTISDKLWAGHKRRKEEHKVKGNGFGYKIFDEESKYTSTLSARYYKDGSEILLEQSNKNPRKLTPRECARLMGFPDAYKIVVGDTQAYKQFGNSVCLPVVKAIAKNIIREIT